MENMGDYSLLINSIEGRLAPFVASDESILYENTNHHLLSNTPSANDHNMVNGKIRKNIDRLDTDSSFNYSLNKQKINSNESITGYRTAKKMRIAADIDELKLQNEQLEEKLEFMQTETDRMKEKLQRQLSFLDQENNELRNAVTKANEKYYEEKKNWQTKLRSLEADVSSLKKQQQQSSSSQSTSTTTSKTSLLPSAAVLSEQRAAENLNLQSFETKLLQKTEQVRVLSITNAKYEEQISKLEQDLLLSRAANIAIANSATATTAANIQSTSAISTTVAPFSIYSSDTNTNLPLSSPSQQQLLIEENKELKKRVTELESLLRRKTREVEKQIMKYENQTILEDEIMSLKNKYNISQLKVMELQQMENKYQVMITERNTWIHQLKDSIQLAKQHQLLSDQDISSSSSINSFLSSSTSSSSTNTEVVEISPSIALRILSATQKKCVTLLQNEGKLETQVHELKRQLSSLTAVHQQTNQVKNVLQQEKQEIQSRCRLLQQQVGLYTGEIDSLRAIVKSYDAEFQIGRPRMSRNSGSGTTAVSSSSSSLLPTVMSGATSGGGDKSMNVLIAGKDTMIANLRTELDQCRAVCHDLSTQLTTIAATTASASATRSVVETQTDTAVADTVEEEQLPLDYDPQSTKVLHMMQNPLANKVQQHVQQFKQLQGNSINTSSNNNVSGSDVDMNLSDGDGGNGSSGKGTINNNTAVSSSSATTATSVTAAVDSSKLNQRLKEMFKERIVAFREAVYLLTGYKIDLIPCSNTEPQQGSGSSAQQQQQSSTNTSMSRLRLRSMYSEHPDDCLLFQLKGSVLELLDTPFASKLDPKVFAYLTTCNSVPCFLSTITMELFDNQTFLG